MGDINNPESANLCIRTYPNNVDTTLAALKTLYPVTNTFKPRQKSNSGRLIPFETIDNNIDKAITATVHVSLRLKVEFMHG